ncbi:MAG: alpha/beta fold hydrolase [Planctomycetota bacterium]|nr:MAG: alpha/beta fold hydrolase [Planctomycetota bacterium]
MTAQRSIDSPVPAPPDRQSAGDGPTCPPTRDGDLVLLLHGYAAHKVLMTPLELRLRHRGWTTVNWGYPSVFSSIPDLAERFQRALERWDAEPGRERVHIVAHSMGCIVVRTALVEYRPRNLGRIVLICPPNRGSRMARWLAAALGWLSPPLRELSDRPNSFVNRLPDNLPTLCDVGIIRAKWDWIVRPENTELSGIRDCIDVPAIHSSVLWRSATARYVDAFLRTGHFQCDATSL